MQPFNWCEIPIEKIFSNDRRKEVMDYALENHRDIVIVSTSITSRETSSIMKIPVKMIDGKTISRDLPWLESLYANQFLDMVRKYVDESAIPAKNKLHGITINIQIGNRMRYECHIESNPITGLVYLNNHPPGNGGELVISNNPCSMGVYEIQENCVRISPKSGKLFVIQASNHPHFTTPLNDSNGVRVVIVLNYYNRSIAEADRPLDLDKHLGFSK